MTAPGPSWYDVLGVEPDATDDEIRAAWRAGIADLEPADRRFALLNQAAEVLLDTDRRAAYDAELVVAEPEPEPEPMVEPDAEPRPETPEPVVAETAPRPARAARPVPGWVLVGLGVLVLLVGTAAGVVAATIPSDRSVEDATRDARAAAERAIVPVLSYDAAHLDESKEAAEAYLTGAYRTKYDKLYDGVIAPNAPSTGTAVTARLVRSSVVRADADRVRLFLLVDQSRTNDQDKKPVVYRNWVTVTMERVGDDWLVSAMDT